MAVLVGDANNNVLVGTVGDDTLTGLGGDDNLQGRGGNDLLDGGAGLFDYADYSSATGGVSVDLSVVGFQVIGADQGSDSLVGIEGVIGSAFNDTLSGTGGSDFFTGGAGDDLLSGGDGEDRAQYWNATGALHVDLRITGPQNVGGGQGVDTLVSIEGVTGGDYNDVLIGSDNGRQVLDGGAGDDTLSGLGGDSDDLHGGAGNDLLDGGAGQWDSANYYGAAGGVRVDLNLQGSAQNTGGAGIDTLTGIEIVYGSSYNDTLTGDGNSNSLGGDVGDDVLDGRGGYDNVTYWSATSGVHVDLTLQGAAQDIGANQGWDTLFNFEAVVGSAYSDTLSGDAGDNYFNPGAGGDDVIDGRGGWDNVDYQNAATGVWVDLSLSGVSTGAGAGADQLISIESVQGSYFNDTLTGNELNNGFWGRAGDDLIDGRGGFDNIDYLGAAGAVTVDLAVTTAQDVGGGEGLDTLLNLENVSGSEFNDTLSGTAGDNFLEGRDGDDLIDGRAGIDMAGFNNATGAVQIDLTVSGPQVGGAGVGHDTLLNIENLLGGAYNDTLVGDGANNYIDANGGNDTVSGGAGFDNLRGNDGDDSLSGGSQNDNLEGGKGNDTLDGGADNDWAQYFNASGGVNVSLAVSGPQAVGGGEGIDTLISIEGVQGSAFADTLTGGAGNDSFVGGAGDDRIDGGAGDFDQVQFWGATAGVTVNLSLSGPQSIGAGLGMDTIVNVEEAYGTQFGDQLTGTETRNFLGGGDGNDTLSGLGGNDNLSGDNGDDLLDGGLGDDQLTGGAGADTLQGGDGNDNLFGFQGDDVIDGGAGVDNAGYFSATSGVHVDLAIAGAQVIGADQGSDTLISIENTGGSDVGNDELFGAAGANVLNGNGGNDTLTGRDGNDTLLGGAGDDLLDGGAGVDFASYQNLNGGAGVTVDLSNTAAQAVGAGQGLDTFVGIENVAGTNFNDQLSGDANNNLLVGNGGNDTLNGQDGADLLFGGFGADLLIGGAGTDVAIYTGPRANYNVQVQTDGSVFVFGPEGSDTLTGVENISFNDGVISALAGQDVVGTEGPDSYTGTNGNDTASGLGGSDTAWGGAGNDSLSGGAGDDFLRAEGGDDTLSGGADNDFLSGGVGNDLIDGGAGFDRASFAATSGANVSLMISGPQNTGQGIDTLIGIEHLSGSAGSDTLTGDDGANWLWGGATGNEVLTGNGGDDLLQVGTGDHVLSGGAGIDTVAFVPIGGPANGVNASLALQGASQVTGQGAMTLTGVENLSGTSFGDTLTGDAGANVLAGDEGSDSLSGGLGDDTLLGDGFISVDSAGLGASGPIKTWINLDAFPGAAFGNDTVSGGGGNDSITGGDGADLLNGDEGNDSLAGDQGADVLNGGAGLDYMLGGAGNDTLSGGDDNDNMFGDQGDDLLDGGAGVDNAGYYSANAGVHVDLAIVGAQVIGADQGTDTLVSIENTGGSNVGNDELFGDAGANVLAGNGGADTLSGRDGNDVLIGGAGNDSLSGGSGQDVAIFSGAQSNYIVTDLGGGLWSIADQRAGAPDGTDTLSGVEVAHFSDGDRLLTVAPPVDPPLTLVGTNKADVLTGKGGNDVITGDNGNDLLSGAGGNDTLSGDNGEDTLSGGAGNDALNGGNGKDVLDGGTGNDTLTGANGNDLFVFSGGHDVITDFNHANDQIDVSDYFASFAALKAASQDTAAGVLVTANGADSILLQGVSLSALSSGDFLFV